MYFDATRTEGMLAFLDLYSYRIAYSYWALLFDETTKV